MRLMIRLFSVEVVLPIYVPLPSFIYSRGQITSRLQGMSLSRIIGCESISADLARHASFQGLKCLHVKLLEEEINFHSEHVGLLDGVHASLSWLETIIAPTLVGHHLLD